MPEGELSPEVTATAAVKVTGWPETEGLAELTSVVLVVSGVMVSVPVSRVAL